MKKVNWIIIIITIFFTYLYIVFNYNNITFSKYLIILSLIPILIFIKLGSKYLNVSDYLEFFYILFIFLSLFLGSIINLYSIFKYYDKIVHFISGIISSTLAVKLLQKANLKGTVITHFFIIVFTLAVAAFWEIFEYTSDLILKGDVQHALTTGVNDTMTDIISAFLASIVFCFLYVRRNRYDN